MNTHDIAKLVFEVVSHRADIIGLNGVDKVNFICGYLMSELEQVLNATSTSNRDDYVKLMQERLK